MLDANEARGGDFAAGGLTADGGGLTPFSRLVVENVKDRAIPGMNSTAISAVAGRSSAMSNT
jgi:hypothetical protein